MGPQVSLATAGDIIRLGLILLLVAVVGLGPLVIAYRRRMSSPEMEKPYRDHHDPGALERLERRHGHVVREPVRAVEVETDDAPVSAVPDRSRSTARPSTALGAETPAQ